jgi:hypothetical protein
VSCGQLTSVGKYLLRTLTKLGVIASQKQYADEKNSNVFLWNTQQLKYKYLRITTNAII